MDLCRWSCVSQLMHFVLFVRVMNNVKIRPYCLPVPLFNVLLTSLSYITQWRGCRFFFISFNLLVSWQLSVWNCRKPFFSLLYNCQLLLFLATCFKYCSRGLPMAFYSDIAPSRMFTTNSLRLIVCPIHEWGVNF